MAQPPHRKQIVVDVNEFVRTRDALGSAYLGLSASLDKAVKAYLDHTNVVLAGDSSLNISYLTQPFVQLAQTAQQALLQGVGGSVAPIAGPPTGLSGGGVGGGGEELVDEKRIKRAYKKRDPNAPKRPQTAYFRYLNENRSEFAKELSQTTPAGTQKPGDITKLATEKWHKLTPEEQLPYREAYQRELKDYENAVARYKAEGGLVEPGVPSNVDLSLTTPAPAPAPVESSDEDSSEDDSSEDDSSSESDDEPPPAPKTPSGKSSKKKDKESVPAVAPERKRKAPAAQEAPETKRKKSSKSDAAGGSSKEKKKKKKVKAEA